MKIYRTVTAVGTLFDATPKMMDRMEHCCPIPIFRNGFTSRVRPKHFDLCHLWEGERESQGKFNSNDMVNEAGTIEDIQEELDEVVENCKR